MKKRVVLILFLSILLVMPFISAQESGDASVDFYTTGWYCNSTSLSSFWGYINEESRDPEWIVGGDGDGTGCFDHSEDYGDTPCCPTNIPCNGTVADGGTCVLDGWAESCWQLSGRYGFTQDACEISGDLGIRSVEEHMGEGYCGRELLDTNATWEGQLCEYLYNVTECQCTWVEATEECVEESSWSVYCQLANGTETDPTHGIDRCWWIVVDIDDRCNTTHNDIIVTTEARWEGMDPLDQPEGCNDDVRTYNCPSGAALGFFPIYGLFASLMLIVVIYSYLLKKKE